MSIFTTGLLAALFCFLFTPGVRWLALALGIVDHPGGRKIHKKPMPRLGGFSVYLSWLLALTLSTTYTTQQSIPLQLRGLIAVGFAVVLLGMLDDWKDLNGLTKLCGQVLIATLVYAVGIRINHISNPFGGILEFPWPLSYLLTVVWVVGMMNALNLIDGLDGLATGISLITALGLITAGIYLGNDLSNYILAALAGACGGFLIYNFHPAKIFLGDCGSQFLGYIFACTALVSQQYKAAAAVSLLVPLCALSIPIYDTALAFMRRLRGGKSVFRADRFHLHHRLLKMGLSQRQAVFFFYLVAVYLNCFAFLFVLIPQRFALVLLFLLGLGVVLSMQILRFVELRLRQQTYRRVRRNLRPSVT
jgi:UDP-GlcNAc:undecaprenyl-phosphate GlcNAc-1-phosphate transferase